MKNRMYIYTAVPPAFGLHFKIPGDHNPKLLCIGGADITLEKFYLKINYIYYPSDIHPVFTISNRSLLENIGNRLPPSPNSPYNTHDIRFPDQQVFYLLSGNLYSSQILSQMRDLAYTHLLSLKSVPCWFFGCREWQGEGVAMFNSWP